MDFYAIAFLVIGGIGIYLLLKEEYENPLELLFKAVLTLGSLYCGIRCLLR